MQSALTDLAAHAVDRHDTAQADGNYSDSVDIYGDLPHARRLDRDTLLGMARNITGPATIACYTGRHIRDVSHQRGVLLTDLLDLAGMTALSRAQCKQL